MNTIFTDNERHALEKVSNEMHNAAYNNCRMKMPYGDTLKDAASALTKMLPLIEDKRQASLIRNHLDIFNYAVDNKTDMVSFFTWADNNAARAIVDEFRFNR